MPKITIREQDLTSGGIIDYTNHSVVVPGFYAIEETLPSETEGDTERIPNPDYIFNKDGIVVLNTVKEFEKHVGIVDENKLFSNEKDYPYLKHYGNKIAYLLLSLGYQVVYKKLGPIDQDTDIEGYYTNLLDLVSDDFWEPLYDKGNYDFRFIITGLGEQVAVPDEIDWKKLKSDEITALKTIYTTANEKIAKLAGCKFPAENVVTDEYPGRGDCTALIDVDKNIYCAEVGQKNIANAIINWVKTNSFESNTGVNGSIGQYVAYFAPSFCYRQEIGKYSVSDFPAYVHYLASYISSINNDFAEWFAISGLTRGVNSYTVDSTIVPIGEIAMNKLQPRVLDEADARPSVNVIMKIRQSYYLWGNRTAFKIDSRNLIASHFLNIRQLCSTLKKQIYYACKQYSFDPNSDILWVNFCNYIRPTLEKMKGNQGITSYKFIKVKTDKKAELRAKIVIRPIEAVEDFDITVVLTDDTVSVEG